LELAKLLGNASLSAESLAVLGQLIDRGVNPESLAAVVGELQHDKASHADK
jgi:hypothetical protein